MPADDTPEAKRLAAQRITDLEELAYERGQRAARVDGRLIKLEDHAKAVNGQIARMANTQDEMNTKLGHVIKRLDDAALVQQTLAKATEQSGARKLGRWQLAGMVLAIPVGTTTIVLYILEALHHA